MKTLIVIPARYGSKRFPGKPLAPIAGRTMLERVAARAKAAAAACADACYVVATDDERIKTHCETIDAPAVLTDPALPSGSDRALAAADALIAKGDAAPDIIVNLQGDAPFTPISYIADIISVLSDNEEDCATPCVRLPWPALKALKEAKTTTPFSGTTCIVDRDGRAVWFSKRIIPAIRNQSTWEAKMECSPVLRHVGLYAFRLNALRQFVAAPPSQYETLEGLEQLRLLENGLSIRCVEVEPAPVATSGVDTLEDVARIEALIAKHGDPDADYFDD